MTEEIVRSEYLYRGRVVKLRLDEVRLGGAPHRITAREIIEHRGAAVIVALDPDERVLLVRQYRAGVGRELLELPAGTLEEGEDPALCATRELKEETGYQAFQWDLLGYLYPSPGYCTEKMYLYLARQLTGGTPSPEDDERIQSEWVRLSDAMGMIDRGEIVDAKTIVGVMRVNRLVR